jgi:hypothetical protein
MAAWEAIVEEYLEGTGSRAAAESLRFRIALPPEARQEVETVLRLADRLTVVTQSVRAPAGAMERLGDCLLRAGPPDVCPKWDRDGDDFIAPQGVPQPGADEEAVNAAIEGAAIEGAFDATSAASTPLPAAGPAELQQDLAAFKDIAAAIRREARSAAGVLVPPGAVARLRARLVESREAGEGGASPVVAARILAQLRGETAKHPNVSRPPDVLAAGEELEEGNQSPTGDDDGASDR